MTKKLYKYRFEIFLSIQLVILFGSLFFPSEFYEQKLLPLFHLMSIASGVLMLSKKKKTMWFFIILFAIASFIFGSDLVTRSENTDTILIRLSIYFVFHIIVTFNIIQQVWKSKYVNQSVIAGLMSGYISLGFLAFFLFMSIELVHPGAFAGTLMENTDFTIRADGILYYAYITLLTIGYGEIVPVIPIAQKAAILVGIVGQFYLVIITAVVIEKYIRHSTSKEH